MAQWNIRTHIPPLPCNANLFQAAKARLIPRDLQIKGLRLIIDYKSRIIQPDLDFRDMVWRIDNYMLRVTVGQYTSNYVSHKCHAPARFDEYRHIAQLWWYGDGFRDCGHCRADLRHFDHFQSADLHPANPDAHFSGTILRKFIWHNGFYVIRSRLLYSLWRKTRTCHEH